MSSDRHSRPQAGCAQGVTRNRPWRCQEGRFWAPSPPLLPDTPCLLKGSGVLSRPEADATSLNSSEEKRGYSSYSNGNTSWERRKADSASLPGRVHGRLRGATVAAPPGRTPVVPPITPDGPPRARIGPSSRYRASAPPLPRSAESLPTGLRPIGTPFLGPQSRIPSPYLFSAPQGRPCYRTIEWQSAPSVRSGRDVGDMRGLYQKPNNLSDDHPFSRILAPSFDSAIC